jgi:hypothetical protein
MKKIAILLIVLMMVCVGFLSGCTETTSDQKRAEYKIINNFSGLINGTIEIHGYKNINPEGEIIYSASQAINVNDGETKSYWFEVPENVNAKSYTFGCTVFDESGISDTFLGGAYVLIPFTATFRITGTPPIIKVEFSSDGGKTWRDT